MAFTSTFDQRRLLVTDLDDTWIGSSQSSLEKWHQAFGKDKDSIILVYASGQSLKMQLEAIETYGLSTPDYIISSVGTEIHRLPGEHPLDEVTSRHDLQCCRVDGVLGDEGSGRPVGAHGSGTRTEFVVHHQREGAVVVVEQSQAIR